MWKKVGKSYVFYINLATAIMRFLAHWHAIFFTELSLNVFYFLLNIELATNQATKAENVTVGGKYSFLLSLVFP